MAAPKTVLTFPLDGSRKDFDIPFEYLARKFVVITLIGATRRVLIANSDYRFATKRTVTTTKAWGPGDLFDNIEIRRVTSATERLVDFSDGSVLRAYDLNTAQVQSLHIAEEARDLTADTIAVNNDGDLDARGRKIVNVADGVLDGDAVSMGQTRRWAESALNQANRSEVQANLANNARINAENAQLNAQTAAGQSAGARDIALDAANRSANSQDISFQAMVRSEAARDRSETAAVNSQNSNVNATDQAGRANREADRAKAEADKLGNMNALGGALDAVQGETVWWRGAAMHRDAVWSLSDDDANFRFANRNGVGRMMRMTRDSAENWLLIDDSRGQIRMHSATDGSLRIPGDFNSGGSLRSLGGAVHVNAQSDGQNAHMWLNGPNGVERGLVWAGADGDLHLRGAQGPMVTVRKDGVMIANGGVILADGSYALQSDGNIRSPIYAGGTLHSHLSQLSNPTPRKLSIVPLWTGGAVGTGNLISLNDDAFNFSSFMSMYSGTASYSSWSGMLELCALPLGTTMYLSVAPNGWIACKFEDANPAQRRQLRLIQFGANNGLTGFYGVRVNPPA